MRSNGPIGTRRLCLTADGCTLEVSVEVMAPEMVSDDEYACAYSVHWPDGFVKTFAAHGADSLKALSLALEMLSAYLHTHDAFVSGRLSWWPDVPSDLGLRRPW